LLKFFAYQQIGRVKDAAALDAVRTSGFSKMQAPDDRPRIAAFNANVMMQHENLQHVRNAHAGGDLTKNLCGFERPGPTMAPPP